MTKHNGPAATRRETMMRREILTRREIFLAGAAAAAGAIAVPARAQEKIAQATVQYQKVPKDGQKCDTCVNFQPPNACKIVAGVIDPNGWCIAYAPKSG